RDLNRAAGAGLAALHYLPTGDPWVISPEAPVGTPDGRAEVRPRHCQGGLPRVKCQPRQAQQAEGVADELRRPDEPCRAAARPCVGGPEEISPRRLEVHDPRRARPGDDRLGIVRLDGDAAYRAGHRASVRFAAAILRRSWASAMRAGAVSFVAGSFATRCSIFS